MRHAPRRSPLYGPALLLLLGPGVAAAETTCPAPTTVAELTTALAQAETRYRELEVELLSQDLARVDATLACLGERVSPELAGAVHRLHGLKRDLAEDAAARDAFFAAAAAADPKYQFPPELLAPGNPTAQAYEAARGQVPEALAFDEPAKGTALYWDGAQAAARPIGRPGVLQVVQGRGVNFSGLLMAEDPLPEYPKKGALAQLPVENNGEILPNGEGQPNGGEPTNGEEPKPERRWIRTSLVAAGGGLLVGSAALGAGAWTNKERFEDEFFGPDARVVPNPGDNPDKADAFRADVEAAESRGLLFTGAAAGAGVLGATALTLGLVIQW